MQQLARRALLGGAVTLGLVLGGSTAAAGDGAISEGEMIANSCLACHGPGGQGAESMPPLAGWDEEALVEVMKEFREGRGDPTVMDRHATGYTDEQLRAAAAYIAEMDQ
ncbi:c-type cytochrome [Halorhodospira sp. 9622]|uniref:c-type cytochrome n=1 Tax=Halorhodospira sp. 9622 TaxID=2899136 RepID=UPI001EE901E4|nr:c-type cytochrome [Halorhodospira sp. 9622]MCG5537665.1 c-type cytochrome [Halorhodospira sp. 9622]